MPYNNIPIRPRNRKFRMEAKEMDCLTWYVLSGYKKEDAFGMFVKPDLVMNKKMLKEVAMQFFASADARDYISAYRATLDGRDVEQAELSDDDKEKRKVKAVQSFTDQIVDKMTGSFENVEDMSKTALLAERVGLLGDGEEVQEAPRRYITARCYSDCQYRLFCEQHIASCDIIDDCQFCRALEFAKDRGFVYDKTKLLNMPKENE